MLRMKKFIKRFIFSFINDWCQFLPGVKFNWYTFILFNCEFEYEKYLEGYSFELILLGLGFRIRYNTPKSDPIFEDMEKEVNKAMKKYKK